jgi:hypothetical protein
MDSIKRLYGVYRGVVQDNSDPQTQRRLKVQVQTTGIEVTDWAWPMEPSSIHTEVPVVGQGVWITYVGGDPEYPVWAGAFGKNRGSNKQMFIKPLANTVSLTGLTPYLQTTQKTDGTTEVDLTDTIMLMANKLKAYETRIASLESQLVTIKNTLATRTTTSHTHGSNG